MMPPPNKYIPNPPIHMIHLIRHPLLIHLVLQIGNFDAITNSQLFKSTLEDNQGGLQAVQPRKSDAEGGGW
jgi:hypothetical protein